MMKRAFTLLEVQLAILVMAGGILSAVTLFSLGFRESRQSVEDLQTAAYADLLLGKMTMAISEMDWTEFNGIKSKPNDSGWMDYLDNNGKVISNPNSLASTAFQSVAKEGLPTPPRSSSGQLAVGVIVLHNDGDDVVYLGVRSSQKASTLMTAPMYFTAVNYQGKYKEGVGQ